MIAYLDAYVAAAEAQVAAWLEEATAGVEKWRDQQIELIEKERDMKVNALEFQKKLINSQIDALETQLELLEDWKGVADNLKNTIDSLRYSTSNPVPISAQVAGMTSEIMALQAKMAVTTNEKDRAALADQLRELLEKRLQLGQEIYDRPSKEYQDLYAETMKMLESLYGEAKAKSDAAIAIEEQIGLLRDQLEPIEKAIEQANEYAEMQIKAINDMADAQIKQLKKIADVPDRNYNKFNLIYNDGCEEAKLLDKLLIKNVLSII
jgi:hypothetical protein